MAKNSFKRRSKMSKKRTNLSKRRNKVTRRRNKVSRRRNKVSRRRNKVTKKMTGGMIINTLKPGQIIYCQSGNTEYGPIVGIVGEVISI